MSVETNNKETSHKETKHAMVIGAGIAGCATAHALANRGYRITLIERQSQIAQAASGNPVGVLYPRLAGHPTPQDTLSLHSYLYTLALIQQLNLAGDAFGACGVLQLAFNPREHKRLTDVTQRGLSTDVLHWVTAAQASAIAGITLTYDGVFLPKAGWVKPPALCAALIAHPNITLMTNCDALQLEQVTVETDVCPQNTTTWRVKFVSGQRLEADVVVVANANDALHFAQTQHLPLTPVRGQVTTTAANASSVALNTVVCTEGYVTPAVDDAHCFGASFEVGDQDLTERDAENHSNLHMLSQLSPALSFAFQAQPLRGRVALRCATPDYLPLVGELMDAEQLNRHPPRANADSHRLPWLHGLYINVGHGAKGLTTAPYCAELLANYLTTKAIMHADEVSALQALNPNRFLLRQLGLKRLAAASGFR